MKPPCKRSMEGGLMYSSFLPIIMSLINFSMYYDLLVHEKVTSLNISLVNKFLYLIYRIYFSIYQVCEITRDHFYF